MRRFFLLLAVLLALLIPAESVAGPFMVLPKRGSAWSVSYSAEALAYKARVEADGGLVVSMADVDAAYQFLSDNTLTATAWWSPQFGVKTGGTTLLSSQSITCNLSFAAGYAFISNPSVDLTPYVGTAIKITDSAGKSVYGWIKAAGTGETYGDELLESADCESADSWSAGVSLSVVAGGQSGNCFQATYVSGTAYILNPADTTAGSLLKLSAYIKSGTSGDESIKLQFGPVTAESPDAYTTQASTSSWTQMSLYGATARTTTYYGLVKPSTEGNVLYDTVSMKQVLTPSSTGVTIVSTSGGSTYNWASEDSGFNRNDTSYTIAPLVTKLYDLSDNDYDASKATITSMPEWRANQKNGRATLYFDGTDDVLSHGCSLVGNSSMIVVAKGVDAGQSGARAMLGASNASELLQAVYARRSVTNAWGTWLKTDTLSSYAVYGTWRLMMVLSDGVNENPTTDHLYTNNESVEDKSGTGRYSDANDRRVIGGLSAADSAYFNGQIADIALFASQIGATPIANMKTLQNTKWAVYE